MKPVIIACAPTAHEGAEIPSDVVNPVSPEDIHKEIGRCVAAGAAVVHLHVRDRLGRLSFKLSEYQRTLDLIEDSGIEVLINGSTGGFSTLTRDERCVSLKEPRTRIASLNMGSANVGESVYINTLADIRYWANKMKNKGIVPELEVFDLSMIQQCCLLREEGLLPDHLHFNFCFGFPGALSADPQHLAYLVSQLPENSSFGIIHDGMEDLTLLAAAVAFGAVQIRVGYEDSFYCVPKRPALSNEELVQAAVQMVRSLGRDVADYDYARNMWLD